MVKSTYEIVLSGVDADEFWAKLRQELGTDFRLEPHRAPQGNRDYYLVTQPSAEFGIADLVLDRPIAPDHNLTLHLSPTHVLIAGNTERWQAFVVRVVRWLVKNYGDRLLDARAEGTAAGPDESVALPEDEPTTSTRAEGEPKEEVQRLATIFHYLCTFKGLSQAQASGFAEITPKTYRKYRDLRWILSPQAFSRKWSRSIEEATEEVYRD